MSEDLVNDIKNAVSVINDPHMCKYYRNGDCTRHYCQW